MTNEILLAVLAAMGAMVIASTFYASLTNIKLSRIQRGRDVDLVAEIEQLSGVKKPKEQLGFLERTLIIPLATWYSERDSNRRSITEKLDLLFWPDGYQSITEYYNKKVFYTLVGFVLGFLVYILLNGQVGVLSLVAVPLFSIIGFGQPDRQIDGLMRERKEVMTFELKGVLDRLSIAYQSKNSLNAALVDLLASTESDGYITAEIRRAVNNSLRGVPMDEALIEAAKRCDSVPLASQVFYLLSYNIRFGNDLIKPLKDAGDMAMSLLTTALIERGKQNEILMLLPLIFPLFGVAIAMTGPGLYLFLTAF